MNENEEKYRDKYLELREMLKFSIYSTDEIVQKIKNIQAFAKFNQLEVEDLNEAFILQTAQELQPFYNGLWDARLVKDWKEKYQKLSLKIRKIYDEDEVRRDWKGRQYSKGKYDEMMAYLKHGGVLWLDELEARFKKYHEEQICYPDRKEYLLLWDQIVAKYQDRILKRETHHVGDTQFKMISCPAGEFWMGSDDASLTADYWKRSKPKHKVKMTKGFWMGETQVTQELWEKVMGWNSSYFEGCGESLPVESVTWYDCLVFCNKLSELEKFKPCFTLSNIEKDGNHIKKANVKWNRRANGYRLPTEAEWEYCAKAGTEWEYSGSYSLYDVAWFYCPRFDSKLEDYTHVVKTKKANGWGLYDMSGNVWEWCMDPLNPNAYKSRANGIENPLLWEKSPCARVVRGGYYWYVADRCRVALRSWLDADGRNLYLGLRLLRCEP